MNKWITFITCAVLAFVSTGLMAQTIIWGGPDDPNSTFAGGLNGWTAIGVTCANKVGGATVPGSNATWEYKADASPAGGAFAGTNPMASLTAANGAVIFNSDRLDNGGNQNALGTGDCPGPHKGYLLSPIMDFSSESTTILSFHQYYRRFSDTRTLVEVSNNGTDWTVFEVNQELVSNQTTALDSRKSIDISSVAGNQESVQIRFVFDGYYYFWLIDDVQVLNSLPQNSLSMDRHFNPVSNLYIPKGLASGESYRFSARISNEGGNDVTDAFLRVQILVAGTGGAIIWKDSLALDPIPAGTTGVVVVLPEEFTFSPADLEPGQYIIRYSVYQPGISDYFPGDNNRQSLFNITENNDVWQSGELRTYTRPCVESTCTQLAPWAWGTFFFVPEETVEEFRIENVSVAVAGNSSAADLNGQSVDFYMLEILSDDFFGEGVTPGNASSEFVGLGSIDISAADDQKEITIALENLEEEAFFVEKGATYFGYLSMPEGLLMGYDNQYVNFPLNLGDGTVILTSRTFFNGAFQSTFSTSMPFIKLNLLMTTVDNTPLPDHALTLFPNPAGNYTMVDLKLDQTSNITITLADISGKVINFQNFQSVQNMQHTLDTSRLPNGAYIVRVATQHGTSTKKLLIAK